VSDRPAVRPVPSLARASARYAPTHATGRTNGTNTERAEWQPLRAPSARAASCAEWSGRGVMPHDEQSQWTAGTGRGERLYGG